MNITPSSGGGVPPEPAKLPPGGDFAAAIESAAAAPKASGGKETPLEREKRLWETVGVPSEDFDRAEAQYGTVLNPERRTPEFMRAPDFKWSYSAGDSVTMFVPDTHGAVALHDLVTAAAFAGVARAGQKIDLVINGGDMIDKSAEAEGGYRANVGETMKSVLALPRTYGSNLITIPGNHEDALMALTAPHLARSLDGFGDQQDQTQRTGGPEDDVMLRTHALVVASRDRYAGKTFPEMNIDVRAEMDALKPYIQTVDGKRGWIAAPDDVASDIYDRLRTKVLDGMARFDPAIHEYFTTQHPSYVQVGDPASGYLFAHAGVRPHVPLEQQTPYDPMWVRKPFTRSFPDYGGVVVAGHNIHTFPTIRMGIDRSAPQDWQRVFGTGAPPAPGGGTFVGVGLQMDIGAGATHWPQFAVAVVGPGDEVRFALKLRHEPTVRFMDMRDAIDQGYVKLQIQERSGPAGGVR